MTKSNQVNTIIRFIELNPFHPLAKTVNKFDLVRVVGRKLSNGLQYFNYNTKDGEFIMELSQ